MAVSLAGLLPDDWHMGNFLGRIDLGDGPVPVLIADGALHDLTPSSASVSGAIERGHTTPQHGRRIADLDARDPQLPDGATLLAPIDLQCIKAAGVTFAVSAIERVIEERARGDASQAAAIRGRLEERVGSGIRAVVPGSPEAAELKRALIEDGMWSQYLEVAIGPDAEVFTKSPVLSGVGHGAPIGVRSDSSWNNPEPEIVLAVSSRGETVGAMLGNDVNLRDFEGRSALLLGKAKDNTASCALGPFIRLFDDDFTIDDVRSADVGLTIEGTDGFRLTGTSRMSEISRDPLDIAAQAMSEHHYPDGFVLFLGTLFAPTQDRDVVGGGFTHKIGDRVTIASPRLGTLANTVTTSKNAPIWEIGISVFVRDLVRRGLADRI
ncbi:fumarylacetoacetate hydrolase family protein [Sphingomonas suaedae]|uniref:Fumarylacetoacetate hydrolase family protein n=1 Tax=Sphingomonas suaedae TaxID=2599297 RepID=A0A518RGP2_9SPHN|nr:fumarylacetoacetate hydrolase family protein [Sphingomonas suaedae]QDX26625.1 fumarylacetoacetate hydrolase family protein [Sphingomonas suaedae]